MALVMLTAATGEVPRHIEPRESLKFSRWAAQAQSISAWWWLQRRAQGGQPEGLLEISQMLAVVASHAATALLLYDFLCPAATKYTKNRMPYAAVIAGEGLMTLTFAI